MKTIEMEFALANYLDYRQNLIVFNPSWGLYVGRKIMHECDILILSQTGYATEIEIKISKADLMKDQKKKHGHDHPYIKQLWFAVPEELEEIALAEIPDRAGLYVVTKKHVESFVGVGYKFPSRNEFKVKIIRRPKANTSAPKWSDLERYQLARLGAIRAVFLKQKLMELKS